MNNTNVDRSMSILHSTIFNCIKQWSKGESLFNKELNQAVTVHREYKLVKHAFYQSKGVLESLKRVRPTLNPLALLLMSWGIRAPVELSLPKKWLQERAAMKEMRGRTTSTLLALRTSGSMTVGPLAARQWPSSSNVQLIALLLRIFLLLYASSVLCCCIRCTTR